MRSRDIGKKHTPARYPVIAGLPCARLNRWFDQFEIAYEERSFPPASTHAVRTVCNEQFGGAQGKRVLAPHLVPTRLPCARLNRWSDPFEIAHEKSECGPASTHAIRQVYHE